MLKEQTKPQQRQQERSATQVSSSSTRGSNGSLILLGLLGVGLLSLTGPSEETVSEQEPHIDDLLDKYFSRVAVRTGQCDFLYKSPIHTRSICFVGGLEYIGSGAVTGYGVMDDYKFEEDYLDEVLDDLLQPVDSADRPRIHEHIKNTIMNCVETPESLFKQYIGVNLDEVELPLVGSFRLLDEDAEDARSRGLRGAVGWAMSPVGLAINGVTIQPTEGEFNSHLLNETIFDAVTFVIKEPYRARALTKVLANLFVKKMEELKRTQIKAKYGWEIKRYLNQDNELEVCITFPKRAYTMSRFAIVLDENKYLFPGWHAQCLPISAVMLKEYFKTSLDTYADEADLETLADMFVEELTQSN